MAIHLMKFSENTPGYRVALLIKKKAMRKDMLEQHYLKYLEKRGIQKDEVIAIGLEENQQGNTPVSLIKENLEGVHRVLKKLGIQYVLVADASYGKVLLGVRKAEPHYGYVMPTIYAPLCASLTINYQQLFHNPSLQDRLVLGMEALCRKLNGERQLFVKKESNQSSYPWSSEAIEEFLDNLHQYPVLTCDIETKGLHLKDSTLISIAFASSINKGGSFILTGGSLMLLRRFLKSYKGKLIFHNASFDVGRLIYRLFMKNHDDMQGMLEGMELLFKDFEDTQILAYLATNSTAGNKLGLKDLAFEYTGNYALEEIKNISSLENQQIREYNLTDCYATWFVYEKYRQQVQDEQEDVYQKLFKPAIKTLTQTELCGMPLDMEAVRKTAARLDGIRKTLQADIIKHPLVIQFEKELRLDAAVSATAKLKKKIKTEEDFADLHFNPRSPLQLRKLFYDSLDMPVTGVTATGLPSTDSKALDAMIAHLKKTYHLEEDMS